MLNFMSWPYPCQNIFVVTSGGSNANIGNGWIVIKRLAILIALVLTACAAQPQAAYQPADLSGFKPTCRVAHYQVDFLSKEIAAYQAYHATHPVTLEDQRHYEKLKNYIWGLRSVCDAQYL